jgi:hypothetical protein
VKLKDEIGLLLAVTAATAAIFGPGLWWPVGTCVAGDAETRFAARVPASLENRYLDARQMHVGFGAAAMGGWESLGDAAAVSGTTCLRTTHPESPNYYRLVQNRFFLSNYFVYVPAQRSPAERLPVGASSLTQLLEHVAAEYPKGAIIAGNLRFTELRTIAISRAAIDAHPVLQNTAAYYTRPMEIQHERWAYVVALAMHPDAPNAATLLPPGTTSPGIAYALRLDVASGIPTVAPDAAEIVSIGQAVGESEIEEGVVEIFPVGRVGACEK